MKNIKRFFLTFGIVLSFSQLLIAQSVSTVISETINAYKNNHCCFYQFHFSIFDVPTNDPTPDIPQNSYNVICGYNYINCDSTTIPSVNGIIVKKYFLKTTGVPILKTSGKFPGAHPGFSFETNKSILFTDVAAYLTLTLNGVVTVYNLSTSLVVVKLNSYVKNGTTLNDYVISGIINPSDSGRKKFISIYISQVSIPLPG